MLSKIQSYNTASQDTNVLPVAVISLEDHMHRRSAIQSKGLPREWAENYWPATDFRDADHATIGESISVALLKNHLGRGVRPGEVGCALSHHNVACWLSASPHDLMLVLEDDAVPLTPEFEQYVLSAAETLEAYAKSGAAIVCLLSLEMKFVRHALKRRVHNRGQRSHLRGPEIFLHNDPDFRVWRAHAYLISKGAASRARTRETRMLTLADDWHHRRSLGLIDRIFYSAPVIFGLHGALESSIDVEGGRQLTELPEALLTDVGNERLKHSPSRIQKRRRRALAWLQSLFPLYT